MNLAMTPHHTKILFFISFIIFPLINFNLAHPLFILDPQNVFWLLSGGDKGASFLGWHIYRESPWMFPLGWSSYGMYPSGYSMAMTDSIPIVAIFLKLVSRILPESFQYFGIWYLINLYLVFIFSYRIAIKLLGSKLPSLMTAILASLMPAMYFRAGHVALSSFFIIFAALYLALNKPDKKNLISFVALNCIAIMIHPYFYLTTMIITVFYLCYWFDFSKPILAIQRSIATVGASLVTGYGIYYLLGIYRYIPNGSGFGQFSMNLNALINPLDSSRIFDGFKTMQNQAEGFQYLGAGWLLLIAVSLAIWIKKKELPQRNAKNIVVICYLMMIALLALSHKIYLGDELFVHFHFLDFMMDYLNIFRASGRFFWPGALLIFFLTIYGLRKLNPRYLTLLLFSCILLQYSDIKFREIHKINYQAAAQSKPKVLEMAEKLNSILTSAPKLPTFITLSEKNSKNLMPTFYVSTYVFTNHNLPVNRMRVARIKYDNRFYISSLDETLEKGGWYYSIEEECKNYEKEYMIEYFYDDYQLVKRCFITEKLNS